MIRIIFLAVLGSVASQLTPDTDQQKELSFELEKTWNGEDVTANETVLIRLSGDGEEKGIVVKIEAPFHDDESPKGRPGMSFPGLWDYEVVQLFFMNSKNQYLEVEIGPYGHHLVVLLDGQRNTTRHSLPLEVATSVVGSRWVAQAHIPHDYFPSQVQKFNAYALHGVGEDRQYLTLNPTFNSSKIDIHDLSLFQPIDISVISNLNERSGHSPLWEAALEGIFKYEVSRQWNGFRSNIKPSLISLQGFEEGVEINFTIPINKDPYPAEAFVITFENDAEEALTLRLLGDGSYSTHLLQDREIQLNSQDLSLDYLVHQENPKFIQGSALVPPTYFPPNVSLMNIYILFGRDTMIALSLQPADIKEKAVFMPDLSSLDHFIAIDFDLLVRSNKEYSNLWRELLGLPIHEDDVTTTETPEGDTDIPTTFFSATSDSLAEDTTTESAQPDLDQREIETTTETFKLNAETTTETLKLDVETTMTTVGEEKTTPEDVDFDAKKVIKEDEIDLTTTEISTKIENVSPENITNSSQLEMEPETDVYTTTDANIEDAAKAEEKETPVERPEVDVPLRFLLHRGQSPSDREGHPRRYDESDADQNELPITFQITFKPQDQAVKEPSKISQGYDVKPDSKPEVVETKPSKTSDGYDVKPDSKPEVVETIPEDEKLPLVIIEEEVEVDIIQPLLPPPHPICFTEGLVPDRYRCQVFYECVIEDGQWQIYRWRCKRGSMYDPETVSCIRGYC